MSATTARLGLGVAAGVVATVATTMAIAAGGLGLHGDDLALLLRLLVGSAAVALAVGAGALWVAGGRRWDRLGTRIAIAQAVGVVVATLGVLPTTLVMFSSVHDRNLLTLLLAYSLAIAATFAIAVGHRLSASLEATRAAAARMAAGDLAARVPVPRAREVAELAVTLNGMAKRLGDAAVRQREMEASRQGLIAAVSHDLRTPVASLRLMAEAIADGVAADPATVRRYAATMAGETIALGRLIDDLFELARLDAGQLSLRRAPSQLAALVGQTLAGFEAQAGAEGVALADRVDAGLPPVLVDPDRIQRVLSNLVQNAIRHTPADGTVSVDAVDLGGDVQVNVHDTGAGIATDDLPHVFEHFYRGDKARARDVGRAGSGLGLAIARRLVEAHGGHIWVAQPAGGGSVFSFTLPKETRP